MQQEGSASLAHASLTAIWVGAFFSFTESDAVGASGDLAASGLMYPVGGLSNVRENSRGEARVQQTTLHSTA